MPYSCVCIVAAFLALAGCRAPGQDGSAAAQQKKADWKARVDEAHAYGKRRKQEDMGVVVQSATGVEVLPAKTAAEPAEPADQAGARPEVTTLVASTPVAELARLRERARNAVGIVMYSASWCGVCSAARAHMRAKRIAHVERDVEKRDAWKRKALALNPRGSVPTFDVDGLVMIGFGEEQLDELIARASAARLQRLVQGPKTILVKQP